MLIYTRVNFFNSGSTKAELEGHSFLHFQQPVDKITLFYTVVGGEKNMQHNLDKGS